MGVMTGERCHGEGSIGESTCPACSGEGRFRQQSEIVLKVPPGVSTVNCRPLAGMGDVGQRGGPAGDLIAHIEDVEHPLFRRDEDDLLVEVPVSAARAALGGKVEVPTLGGGKAMIDVQAGTQTGRLLRLRGKGIKSLQRSGSGDLLVRIVVVVPSKVSDRAKKLFQELETLPDSKTPPPRRPADEPGH